MRLDPEAVRVRVIELVRARYGRVDERLIASGILDSLGAVDFAVRLEREFSLQSGAFFLEHLSTVDALVRRIVSVAREAE